MAKVETKFTRLGLTPPGSGDLDRAWLETVCNLVRGHREALSRAEYGTTDADKADAKERAGHYHDLLDQVPDADVKAAMAAIEEAESYPQHIAAVGAEPMPPEEAN